MTQPYEYAVVIYEAVGKRICATYISDDDVYVSTFGADEDEELAALEARGGELPGFSVTVI